MWVFGYGSLVWYTNFPFDKSVAGCLRGFARRFWQASPDHRGTHEKGSVWGIAYHVAPENEAEVRKYLAWREKAGYEPKHIPFHPHPDTGLSSFVVEVFVSPPDNNQHYIGPEDIETTANIIVPSVGPSGTNIEYILRLEHHLKMLHPDAMDDYLRALVNRVIAICKERNVADPVLKEFGYK